VGQIVKQMLWNGSEYDIFRCNCCTWANKLCKQLVGHGLPGWVKRFPKAVALAAIGLAPVVDLSAMALSLFVNEQD